MTSTFVIHHYSKKDIILDFYEKGLLDFTSKSISIRDSEEYHDIEYSKDNMSFGLRNHSKMRHLCSYQAGLYPEVTHYSGWVAGWLVTLDRSKISDDDHLLNILSFGEDYFFKEDSD